ncbi:MAG: VOC family protein [Thermoleophilia bacterium]|nr:VOC family protein [Thermoleophilia bacterium]
MDLITANTILYCGRWDAAVVFYRDGLGLPILFSTDWFVEFRLSADSRLSVADETRASVRRSGGVGITISLEVDDIDAAWKLVTRRGLEPTAICDHPWQARVFHLFDPEGHRIEIWQRSQGAAPA